MKKLFMNLAVVTLAFSAFAAGAQAQVPEIVEFTDFRGTKTRAEVIAELKAHRAEQGHFVNHEVPMNDFNTAPGKGKTREQVKQELMQARAAQKYPAPEFPY